MIEKCDTEGLRANSQTALIKNGFKDVCFRYRLGSKPQHGTFVDACLGEILHLILLCQVLYGVFRGAGWWRQKWCLRPV